MIATRAFVVGGYRRLGLRILQPLDVPDTETSVLLQSLLSVNLRAPSTLNNRERLLRK